MIKTHILYEGHKRDFKELEEIFTIGEFTYSKLRENTKFSIDPVYNMLTLDWPWFKALFSDNLNARCICLDQKTLKANGVYDHWGFFNLDTDGIYDFYITDVASPYKKAIKNGFKTAIAYMFIHEYMHGKVWGDTKDRYLAVTIVHDWVDRGVLREEFEKHITEYKTKVLTVSLLERVIKLFNTLLSKLTN